MVLALPRRAWALLAVALAGCGEATAPDLDDAPPFPEVDPATFPIELSIRGRHPSPEDITWRVDGADGPVDARLVRAAARSAGAAWTASGQVAFREAASGEPAAVTISWARGPHGDCKPFGIDGSLAHTGPVAATTFVHLDADRDWSPAGESLEGTLLHEFGHVLGLAHGRHDDSIMRADARALRIGATDAAALASVYGAPAPLAGSLRLSDQEGEVWAVLHGVAPEGSTACAWFDTDGDGDDELLVWRTDDPGRGDLMTHDFDERGLARTRGPFLGAAPPGASLFLHVTEDGQRCLIARRGTGAAADFRIRAFRPTGMLGRVDPELELGLRARFAEVPPADTARDAAGTPVTGLRCRIERVPRSGPGR